MFVYDFFKERIDALLAVKKVARENNLPVWQMPVMDSIGLSLLLSIYASYEVWAWFNHMQEMRVVSENTWIEAVLLYLPVFFFFTIFATILDKIAIVFVHIHSKLAKGVMIGISRLDMKIWRKTGRESVVANAMWKVQRKWMSLSKMRRKQLTAVFIMVVLWYYSLRALF